MIADSTKHKFMFSYKGFHSYYFWNFNEWSTPYLLYSRSNEAEKYKYKSWSITIVILCFVLYFVYILNLES